MFLRVIHRIASHPWVYDRIQALAGADEVYRRLKTQLAGERANVCVLDVGGGTGTLGRLWLGRCRYVCLDIEWAKLRGFRTRFSDGLAVLADAGRMPITGQSVDLLVCKFVSHHLNDELLADVFQECQRVLKPQGKLVFLDALLVPDRLLSRLLWALDRGDCPRTSDSLRGYLEKNFRVVHWERFSVYHEYLLAIGEPALS